MDPKNKNIRNLMIDTGSGKDVRDTSFLDGEAKKTPAESETNSTTQYTTGGKTSGPWGGENTNS